MRSLIITLLILFCAITSNAKTQNESSLEVTSSDSVTFHTSIYFKIDTHNSISNSEYPKIDNFIKSLNNNASTTIEISGWADRSGEAEYNKQLSLWRATFIRDILINKGISAEQISTKGCGSTGTLLYNAQARRVDIKGVVPILLTAHKVSVADSNSHDNVESVVINDVTPIEEPIENNEATLPVINPYSKWYLGAGGDVAFGMATFRSLAMNRTCLGFAVGVLGGYNINKTFSIEASASYTRMNLSAYDCCRTLYLGADGNSYYAPVSGEKSYEYIYLHSMVNTVDVGLHFNIDWIHMWNPNSKWSLLLSPAIYGVYSTSSVLYGKEEVKAENKFHFGAGANIGFGYQINDCLGIRFTSGVNYYTNAIDAMPSVQHKNSYVWRSGLYLTFNI